QVVPAVPDGRIRPGVLPRAPARRGGDAEILFEVPRGRGAAQEPCDDLVVRAGADVLNDVGNHGRGIQGGDVRHFGGHPPDRRVEGGAVGAVGDAVVVVVGVHAVLHPVPVRVGESLVDLAVAVVVD